MADVEYELIRTRRRTLAAQVKDGRVIIRAPMWATGREIDAFAEKHRDWIEKNMTRSRAQQEALADLPPLTEAELCRLTEEAKRVIPRRVAYYAPLVGVTYGRVTIRTQRSRWGSCSAKGNLNFNCLLLLAPTEVLDCVVVHELCHRKEMNHSERFYGEVLRVYPAYHRWNDWLKENGPLLLGRVRAAAPRDGSGNFI